jgi:hypothetical protein
MPFIYEIDEKAGVLRVEGRGDADLAGAEELLRAVAADLRSRPGWPILCDVRELTWVPWPNEIRKMASLLYEVRSVITGPVGVVTERPALFGMARMLSMLVEPVGVRMAVFRLTEDAESWCAETIGAGRS